MRLLLSSEEVDRLELLDGEVSDIVHWWFGQ